MKSKFVLDFTICLIVLNLRVNFNEAIPVMTRAGNGGENSDILCETVCSTPEWKATFDIEKSACLCSSTNSTNGSEEALSKTASTNSVTTMFIENNVPCKRDTTGTSRKDNDTPMPSLSEKYQSDKSKTNNVKTSNVNTKKNVPNQQEKSKTQEITENAPFKSNLKNSNVKVLPQKTFGETNSNTNIINDEGTNVKRIPKDNTKQLNEIESNPAQVTGKDGIEIGRLKPIKSLKKSKSSERIIGDAPIKNKYLKPTTPSKKSFTSCNSLSITNQLKSAKERIAKLIEETKQPNFNCGLLNKEIESIKAILQVMYKGPETKQRELDRAKILEQIREKEKERHARIQSRLGHLDLTKHKSGFVSRIRTTEKPDENSKMQTKVEEES